MSDVSSGESAGIASFKSPYAFDDTVKRLLTALTEHGIKVFTTIDQQAEALAVGLSMPPTTLIVYGNPKAGTPLMLVNLQSALDLPLKVLVTEPLLGYVEVTINTADYLIQRYSLPAALAANLLSAERLIAAVLSD